MEQVGSGELFSKIELNLFNLSNILLKQHGFVNQIRYDARGKYDGDDAQGKYDGTSHRMLTQSGNTVEINRPFCKQQ